MKQHQTALYAILGIGIFLLPLCKTASASVSLVDTDQWKVKMGGFIETDTINDSTRSFSEKIGNAPVARPDTLSGTNGREQFSVRNSRLGFDIIAPEQDGWKSHA